MARLRDRLAHAGDFFFLLVLIGVPVAALLDLTVLGGRIPNGILGGLWLAMFAWVWVTDTRTERELTNELKREAPSLGLEWASDDFSGLPDDVSYKIRPGDRAAVQNVMVGSAGGRRLVRFDTAVLEDRRWWDDEPSTHDLTCCWMRLEGKLPRFHLEIGSGMKRLREGWPEPIIDLSINRLRIKASSVPAAMHDTLYGENMRTYLTRVTHPCHIRVDEDAVLMFTWRSLGASRQIVDDLIGFVDRLRSRQFPNATSSAAAEAPPNHRRRLS